MKKIFDSDDLERIANEITTDCAMLGYVDQDSIDDVEFYKERIQESAAKLRRIIESAKDAGEGT